MKKVREVLGTEVFQDDEGKEMFFDFTTQKWVIA